MRCGISGPFSSAVGRVEGCGLIRWCVKASSQSWCSASRSATRSVLFSRWTAREHRMSGGQFVDVAGTAHECLLKRKANPHALWTFVTSISFSIAHV